MDPTHAPFQARVSASAPAGPKGYGLPFLPWTVKDVVLMVVIGFTLILGGTVGVLLLGWPESGELEGLSLRAGLGLLFVQSGGIGLSVYALGLRRRGFSWRDIGLGSFPRGWLMTTLLVGVVTVPLLSAVGLGVAAILGIPTEQIQPSFLIPERFTWIGFAGTLLLAGVAAPLAEELFFRGVLYAYLRRRTSLWTAAFVSSLFFGLAHTNLPGGAAAFAIGFVLALVYERSGSLWPAVLIHALNNIARTVLIYLLLGLQAPPL